MRAALLRRSVSRWRLMAIGVAMVASACGGGSTPTTPSTTSSTSTETWSGTVAPGGQTTRSFTVNNAGTINITLTAAGTASLGVGVGLPRVTGGGCRLGVSVSASPDTTPQISTSAEAGQYCAQVYDLGNISSDPVGFSLTIEHP